MHEKLLAFADGVWMKLLKEKIKVDIDKTDGRHKGVNVWNLQHLISMQDVLFHSVLLFSSSNRRASAWNPAYY